MLRKKRWSPVVILCALSVLFSCSAPLPLAAEEPVPPREEFSGETDLPLRSFTLFAAGDVCPAYNIGKDHWRSPGFFSPEAVALISSHHMSVMNYETATDHKGAVVVVEVQGAGPLTGAAGSLSPSHQFPLAPPADRASPGFVQGQPDIPSPMRDKVPYLLLRRQFTVKASGNAHIFLSPPCPRDCSPLSPEACRRGGRGNKRHCRHCAKGKVGADVF